MSFCILTLRQLYDNIILVMKMSKKLRIICFICLIFNALIQIVCASDEYSGYIVTFKDDFLNSISKQCASLMSAESNDMTLIHREEKLYKIDEEALEYYVSTGAIESYEPDYYAELMYEPDDTYYNKTYQKYLWNVNAQSAWNLGCYGNGVRIGIIDSGVSAHNDLIGAVRGGRNCVESEISINPASISDYNDILGHGTMVAGVIGAQFNSYRVAGIAPKSQIYAFRVTDANGNIQYSDIIAALDAASAEYDCDIINMSLGGIYSSQSLKKACQNARDKGAILCAASGNYAESQNNPIVYPAAYDNVISVGAVDNDNIHCYYSEYNNKVTICAPGGNNRKEQWFWGLNINSGFAGRMGTSFSCPQVTAAAAIAKNIKPNITHDEFAEVLELTSTDLGDEGYDIYYGHGLLNIDAMTKYLLKNNEFFLSPLTKWSDERTDITFYNNKNETVGFYALWKHDGNISYDILSAKAEEAKEIVFDKSYESIEGYIIDKLSLRPLIGTKTKE